MKCLKQYKTAQSPTDSFIPPTEFFEQLHWLLGLVNNNTSKLPDSEYLYPKF